VLAAIGLVNEKPAFLTQLESKSLNRSLKILHFQVITSTTSKAVQNLVEIHTWGLLGK